MDPPPSAAPPRAPLFSHKVLASLDQVLPPWVLASLVLPPLVPHWGPRWEDLALQVKYSIPTCSSIKQYDFSVPATMAYEIAK